MLRFAARRTFTHINPTPYLRPLTFVRMAHDTISAGIIDDHEELSEYFEKYIKAETLEDKEKWANQYRWELARHTVGEEIILYPAFEKYLGEEGLKIANEERAEHQGQKEMLAKLEGMNVKDDGYRELFEALQADLAEHVKGEEATLAKLEPKISKEESKQYADSFSRMKKFLPTRSHPEIPNKPPFETAAALLLAPMDMIRDMFTAFPEK